MSSEHGVNFVELFSGPEIESIASASLVIFGLVILTVMARSGLKATGSISDLVPPDRFSATMLVDAVTQFVLNLGDSVMGKHNRKYIPFVCSIFLYVASLNLLGLLPGFSMPTDFVAFNMGIALVVFLLYNAWGIKEVGFVKYVKHFAGPVWWLAWLIFPVELLSNGVRPLSLSLRLYGNMMGDHTVLQIFTDLTKLLIPVVFYGLGTFVCLVQAFVFTLLTMIYIGAAVHQEHDEHH